jgi:chemotaxis protein methyltransferase CheR
MTGMQPIRAQACYPHRGRHLPTQDGRTHLKSGGDLPQGMSDRDFLRVCGLIHERCGIRITQEKKALLEGRIRKRIGQLDCSSFHDYCEYLFSVKGLEAEIQPLIDVVTTNKTDFFREPWHFEFLRNRALAEIQARNGAGLTRPFRAWSAACSTGEEPYTLAMVLTDAVEKRACCNFSILATDISSRVLQIAQDAIYDSERVDPVPIPMRKKYLLKSKDPSKQLIRIIPELRERIQFKQLNMMDEGYGISDSMDVAFCRNMIIYFDRPTQQRIVNKICDHLVPGGYLFMGHSETLANMSVPVRYVSASIYQMPF